MEILFYYIAMNYIGELKLGCRLSAHIPKAIYLWWNHLFMVKMP